MRTVKSAASTSATRLRASTSATRLRASTKNMSGKFVDSESLTTKQARAWMRKNAATLLQIALDEDHEWLCNGPEGFCLDEVSQRRLIRVARDFVRRNG